MAKFDVSPIPPGSFPALYGDEHGDGFVITWHWRETTSLQEYTKALLRGHSTTDAFIMAKEVAESVFNLPTMWPEVALDDALWLVDRSYYLTGNSMAVAALLGLITLHKGILWPERLLAWGGMLPSRKGISIQPTHQGPAKMQYAAAMGATRVICPELDDSEGIERGIEVIQLTSRPMPNEMVVQRLIEVLEPTSVPISDIEK